MSGVPSLTTITQTPKPILAGADPEQLVEVTIDSSASGGGSPSHRVEAGNVLAKKSGSTKYIEASRYGDIQAVAAPTLVSAEVPDADWAGKVVKIYSDGLEVASVTLGGADDTLPEVVAAINGDALAAAHVVASSDTNLRITSKFAGRGHSIAASINLTTGFATVSGASSYQSASTTLTEYVITAFDVDTQDLDGAAQDGAVLAAMAGRFNTADLRNLNGQARAALEAQGCIFYS